MEENVALNKKHQSKFARKIKKVKQRLESTGDTIKETPKEDVRTKSQHGIVYVGHIPHGFYEKEMLAYFRQFGKVSNLRLCRSRKTGQSKGYAFVEFASAEVAKIAAETMDNYLMFNKRLVAKYIPAKKSKRLYKGPSWSKTSYPLKKIRETLTRQKNKNIDTETHLKKSKLMVSRVNKSLKKLHELGILYRFQAVDDEYNLNKHIIQGTELNGEQLKPLKE